MIQTEMNTLKVAGEFDSANFQRACAALHQLTSSRGYASVNIDFQGLTKGFAAELLPFAMRCRHLLVHGVDTMLELPNDPTLARLFRNSNWAYLIDPRQYEKSDYASGKHIPMIATLIFRQSIWWLINFWELWRASHETS
ncbi:MAG: hypothetical protein WC689_05655 [Methylocystis sp.]|jgi:hypothetical protein